jgi:hypothetical protein
MVTGKRPSDDDLKMKLLKLKNYVLVQLRYFAAFLIHDNIILQCVRRTIISTVMCSQNELFNHDLELGRLLSASCT